MVTAAAAARPKRAKHSSYIDVDVLAWLAARGERLDRTVDYQIREILRAAMVAEQQEPAR